MQQTWDLVRQEPYGDIACVSFLNTTTPTLDLSSRGWKNVPQLLMRHTTNLVELNLSKNNLKRLPYDFSELEALQVCPGGTVRPSLTSTSACLPH